MVAPDQEAATSRDEGVRGQLPFKWKERVIANPKATHISLTISLVEQLDPARKITKNRVNVYVRIGGTYFVDNDLGKREVGTNGKSEKDQKSHSGKDGNFELYTGRINYVIGNRF